MAFITNWRDEALIALDTVANRASNFLNPTLRLGVTGLSRAGKTVFITALIHNLLHNGRLPMFEVMREGRLISAKLGQQPDHDIVRFEYEKHIKALVEQQIWPDSTKSLSQLRIILEYAPRSSMFNVFKQGKLNIDLIDYPGEWLLDLPLLNKTYSEFSQEAIKRAKSQQHQDHAANWLSKIETINILNTANEIEIEDIAQSYKAYLQSAKSDNDAIFALPPGRFLMPGDYEGAPILTFSPLPDHGYSRFPDNSLAAIMESRYEAYKRHIVKPFFREHIARLDRQIILVDALQAMNSGSLSLLELQTALSDILACFRGGKNNWLDMLWSQKISRILVAATKADHLHHNNHDSLQNITAEIVERAIKKAGGDGVAVETLALAALRTTREGTIKQNNEDLPVVIGTPMAGEILSGKKFDGKTEIAVFPGDIPEELEQLIKEDHKNYLQFVRFRPVKLDEKKPFSQIRLDRAMQFLFGDYLL